MRFDILAALTVNGGKSFWADNALGIDLRNDVERREEAIRIYDK